MDNGRVILVGAGPGDPGLLTLRGREALEAAEVVLYDRLAGDEVLSMLPPEAEAIDVGKNAGDHPVPQDEINALILEHARLGKRVVRLKGGDPYLFGRGAEELEAIVDAGIPFEVVPGVTSAIAAAAYAGIPVTHRDMASSLHIITGHAKKGSRISIDYESLTRLGGTLVFLMGLGALEELTGGLLAAGMAPDTPAALIENGTRPGQRKAVSTLSGIAARAVEQGFKPPSALIVGGVCALAERLDWFSGGGERPLTGVRVAVTRARASSDSLVSMLRGMGCEVLHYPCIRTVPLPAAEETLSSLAGYDWIVFTSPTGAELFTGLLAKRRLDGRALAGARLAAVGPGTASALERGGLFCDLIPSLHDGEALADELLKHAEHGGRVMLFRAKAGAPELAEKLRAGGLEVDDIPAYDTLYENHGPSPVRDALLSGGVDCVAFTSASTVEGFVRSLDGADLSAVTAACIGSRTAAAAAKAGMRVLTADSATLESLVNRIADEFGRANG